MSERYFDVRLSESELLTITWLLLTLGKEQRQWADEDADPPVAAVRRECAAKAAELAQRLAAIARNPASPIINGGRN
jgi:hypothetical protein